MNLNKVFILGRLTRDPETRTTGSGQSVTTIRMATNRVWNDPNTREKRESTEYHSIVAWTRLGEIASQYLRKGALALFEGRLQTRSWEDQSGNKRYMTEIIAENLQMGPRAQGSPSASSGQVPQAVSDVKRPAKPNNEPEPEIPVINEDAGTSMGLEEEKAEEIKDSDLPF
jgi:single-strand DNA-binding protein